MFTVKAKIFLLRNWSEKWEEQFYSLTAVLDVDVEQSGKPVELPKTAPVCETGCVFQVLKSA